MMSMQCCRFFVFVIFFTVVAADRKHNNPDGSLVVQTVQGKLRGKIQDSYTGKKIISFLGVRFAEPPTGPNRFKAPVPLKPWNGVRDAKEDGNLCTQPVDGNITTSEDCLFLNVHTKSLKAKQPVIIFMHYGGFSGGTGNSLYQGPQYFLNQDIVLVTFNYRLGPLGFISTGDAVLPGNYGLRDQLEVLKWVKHNIAQFGGDPDNVTLFGYSAGASSAQFHMLSPLSKGLFHRVIAGSCSLSTPGAFNKNPLYLARKFASALNCSTESSQQIKDCMMQIPADKILEGYNQPWDTLSTPLSWFTPVVEQTGGEDRFLSEDPIEQIKSGRFTQVPVITGFTRDEFNWLAPDRVLSDPSRLERFNMAFDEVAPWEFQYPREPLEVSRNISHALRKFYFNDEPVTNSSEKELGQLYADSIIIFSVYQAAKLIAEKSSAPVYLYMFNFEGRYSFRYKTGTEIPYGVVHHNDMIYLFYSKPWFPLFNETDPEAYMVQTLSHIYSEFAKTGIPRLPGNSGSWEPLTKERIQYLNINKPPRMVEGAPYSDRMELWESLLPLSKPYRQIFY